MTEENIYPLVLHYKKASDDAPFIITEQKASSENGQEVLKYERHTNSLGVSVQNLRHIVDYKTTEELTKDYKTTGKWIASTRNRLTGEGILERGDHRPDTISIFGGKNQTSTIGVEIYVRPEKLSNDMFSFSAYKEIHSYDINNEEAFFLSLYLSQERFNEIAELVRTQSIDDFYISFDAGSLNRIFARPSYFSESQNFKYLLNVKDIDNHSDVPKDFLRREDIAEFEITIVKNARFQKRNRLPQNKKTLMKGQTLTQSLTLSTTCICNPQINENLVPTYPTINGWQD